MVKVSLEEVKRKSIKGGPEGTRSSRKGAEGILMTFTRNFSVLITKIICESKITPNQVTITSLVIGLLSTIFFVLGDYKFLIVGAILVMIYFVLDLVDGELARYKDVVSDCGRWLDMITNNIVNLAIITAITLHFIVTKDLFLMFIGIVAIFNYATINLLTSSKRGIEALKKKDQFQISKKFSLNMVDFFPYLVAVSAVINKIEIVLYFFSSVGLLIWVYLVFAYYKRIKKHEIS